MTRRFVRSIAVVGTIGLSSLGADVAAEAVTTSAVHAVPVVDAEARTGTEDDDTGTEPELVDLATAASTIGMDVSDLHAALRADGATLAGVAVAHGVPADLLEAALVDEAARRLDAEAMAGRISPWEVWERRAVLGDVVAAAVQADRSVSAVR